ncbi:MAG: DNA-binding protein [Mycobacterium sp.]|nr:DNA-binding protein [Mycobacterium sp.]
MSIDELDQLLHDRFDLSRDDLIAALKTLSAQRPWAASLTTAEADLLDSAGLVEGPEAYREITADVVAHMARLISTAYSSAAVAKGLGVNESRIRQRRLERTLWAIDDNGAWVYPAVQFDREVTKDQSRLKQVRGLDQVLAALPSDLHPTAVAGFLLTPQPELSLDNRPRAVRDWLRSGGSVEPVLGLIEIGEWARR